jgi:uncharacterized PurR-regulated membrane protein YhhQ (DUF165 family)
MRVGIKHALLFVAYVTTIPSANWLIGNVGSVCIPNGPCLIPVAPGIMAPSGVLMIGLALVLRDALHETSGGKWTLGAIAAGTILSAMVAPPALIIASAVAFLISELADFGVYAPLRKRGLMLAVITSGIVGAAVDSIVFLLIAFGSLDYAIGQIIGKLWASLAAAFYLSVRR